MNISLIEDEPDCYETYQALLEARGHKVTVYRGADDTIKAMNTVCKSDVVILDLMMRLGTKIDPAEAGETGTALYRRIRAFEKKVPIIVLTARSKSEVWEDFKDDKHVCYLGKPVSDTEEFYFTIENGGRDETH